jgi:hypothetical protein
LPIHVHADHLARANELIYGFDELLDQLVSAQPFRCGVLPAPPHSPGVYLFAQDDVVMHVGRTRDLRLRRRNQSASNGTRTSATFAFQLARHRAHENLEGLPTRREDLEADERFVPLFQAAKDEVREMDFLCVVIADHARQALFEIFASIALGAVHASWRTH